MLLDRWEDEDDDHEESVAFKHWYKTEGIDIEKKCKHLILSKYQHTLM
jgi:hypothetical protein